MACKRESLGSFPPRRGRSCLVRPPRLQSLVTRKTRRGSESMREAGQPDRPLCSRNARHQMMRGSRQTVLLARRAPTIKRWSLDARSEEQSAYSFWESRGIRRPSPGLMARPGVPMGGRVRKLRALEDQSAPIPGDRISELGGIIYIAQCAQ